MGMDVVTVIQGMNVTILILWPILALLALWQIRKRNFSEWLRIAWVLFVVVLPILGPLAFFIVSPGTPKQTVR